MSVTALGSVKGSPGVTTLLLALATAWPAERPLLLVETDADGGTLAARTGLAPEPGLVTLAGRSAATPLAAAELAGHTQPLAEGVSALVAPAAPEQTHWALELVGEPLAAVLPAAGHDVLVDAGRLRPDDPAGPLLDGADRVVLVAQPRLDQLQALPATLARLRRRELDVGLVLVGSGPYEPAQVATALEVEVLATVPRDRRGARLLDGYGRSQHLLRFCVLVRTAVELAHRLAAASDGSASAGAYASLWPSLDRGATR